MELEAPPAPPTPSTPDMPPPPTYPSPPIPQEPIFPRLPVAYIGLYIQGRQSVTAITYNAYTKLWTVTAAGAKNGMVSISADSDQTLLSINGAPSLFIWNSTGMVGCSEVTNNVTLGKWPRIDFLRQTNSVPRWFASVSQFGVLSVMAINQEVAPSGLDRMYLLGNSAVSIGLDGLVGEGGIYEFEFLADQSGKFLVDQFGKYLSAR